MPDMLQWPEILVDVFDDLLLDPANVRLSLPVNAPQVDILRDLFDNEEALEIVESITISGFYRHELPIVIPYGRQYLVAEGNRRIAAMKAIQNPVLAGRFASKVQSLTSTVPDLGRLRMIRVLVAPNRDEANQLVAALHTGNQRKPWTPLRQAAFFQSQLDSGSSFDDLLAKYPTIDVKPFLRRESISRILRGYDYDDDELNKYVGSRKFPISTPVRLFDNPEFRVLVDIHTNAKTSELSPEDPSAFFSIAKKIVQDMRSGRINTRVLSASSSDSFKEYLAEIEDFAETFNTPATTEALDSSQVTSTTTTDAGPDTSDQEKAKDQTAPDEERAKPSPVRLDISGLSPWFDEPALRQSFEELGNINFRTFPLATLLLLRAHLEKSVKVYATRNGDAIMPKPEQYAQLNHCLSYLQNKLQAIKNPDARSVVQCVMKLKSDKDFSGFGESRHALDSANHNQLLSFTPRDVLPLWHNIKPVLGYLYRDTTKVT